MQQQQSMNFGGGAGGVTNAQMRPSFNANHQGESKVLNAFSAVFS
jgi:hypothetical protein